MSKSETVESLESPAGREPAWWLNLIAAGVIVAAGLAVFVSSLNGKLVFDDQFSIKENDTIFDLKTWEGFKRSLIPPNTGYPTDGRPVVNFALAVNYRFGELEPLGYHIFNVTVHLLVALTMFGVIRRTLLWPMYRDKFGPSSTWIALAVTLLWTIHPLQTESVTYICQRAESMVGLTYLLAMYCAIRSFTSRHAAWWYAGAILSCLVGMGTKEVMVSAPLMILLYDRLFVSGSFKEALNKRTPLYAGMMATWGLLGYLVIGTRGRSGTAGFDQDVITPLSYALTQFVAIVRYIKLCFWPSPLVLDYGTDTEKEWLRILPCALIILSLLAGTVFAFVKKRFGLAFLGTWFFVILAPSSSIVPVVTQTVAEHRMYLPLLSVMFAAVLGVRWLCDWALASKSRAVFVGVPIALLLVSLGILSYVTIHRNIEYHSEQGIWEDTVRKAPNNPRAHNNLATELFAHRDIEGAKRELLVAVGINPKDKLALYNLGDLHRMWNKPVEAMPYYDKAIEIEPNYAIAMYRKGNALSMLGRHADAIREYTHALSFDGNQTEVLTERAATYALLGQAPMALADYGTALAAIPNSAEIHFRRGVLLFQLKNFKAAAEDFTQVLAVQPKLGIAYRLRAACRIELGQFDAAWQDVRMLRSLGDQIEPVVLQKLIQLSGRTE